MLSREEIEIGKATVFFEKIALKGIPMKKLNNNYNAKRMERFFKLAKDCQIQVDFEKFQKMEYQEAIQEASKNLNTYQAKKAY